MQSEPSEAQAAPLALVEAMLKSVREKLSKARIQEQTLLDLLSTAKRVCHDRAE